ncbi:sodium/potassium-transporting ATPase subunit beta-like [Haemaphysalis longicornis]
MLLVVMLEAMLLANGRPSNGTNRSSVLALFPRTQPGQDLIWFRNGAYPKEAPRWENLTDQLKPLVEGYQTGRVQGSEDIIVCGDRRPEQGRVCFFDVRAIAPECTADQDFGYPRGSPCVFIQFANVTGWDPEPLTEQEASQVLPEGSQPLVKPSLLPLHCDGDTPADRENIGDLVYSPYQGFRTEFFPYTGHPDYMPPLVAVQFRRPQRGVVIGVRCRLLARNPPPGNASTEISFFLFVE